VVELIDVDGLPSLGNCGYDNGTSHHDGTVLMQSTTQA
jgi:hypothetical protein